MIGIGIRERILFLVRSLSIQGSWSYRHMQGLGYFFVLYPWLRRITGDDFHKVFKRHLTYFNTHPIMASYLFGVSARLDEEGDHEGSVRAKNTLMGPMGAAGDSLFWGSLRPLVTVSGLCVALFNPLAGVFTLLFLHNAIQLFARWFLFDKGFENAADPLSCFADHDILGYSRKIRSAIAPPAGFLLGMVAVRTGTPGTVLLLFCVPLSLYLMGRKTLTVWAVVAFISLILGVLGLRMELPWFLPR